MDFKEYFKKHSVDISEESLLRIKVGNILMGARIERGISQKALAKAMGTQQPSIARAEKGEVLPSLSFLLKAAKVLGAELILPSFSFYFVDNRNTTQNQIISLVK